MAHPCECNAETCDHPGACSEPATFRVVRLGWRAYLCQACHDRARREDEIDAYMVFPPDSAPVLPRDIAWIDDNDGRGPVKLSNSVRCF